MRLLGHSSSDAGDCPRGQTVLSDATRSGPGHACEVTSVQGPAVTKIAGEQAGEHAKTEL